MTRQEIIALIDATIFTNASKLIVAAQHNPLLKELIASTFVKDSDLLKDLNYDTGVTLEKAISGGGAPLIGLTGQFIVGGPSQTIGGTGVILTAVATQLTTNDTQVTITFNQDITDKHVVVSLTMDSADTNANDDVGTPIFRKGTNGITVGIRLLEGGTSPTVRVQCLLFQS